VWGQAAESGSIVGTVVDPSGTAIPDVKVTLTSPALQVPQLTTVTDAEGSYKFVNLPAPGVYRATFEREGFQAFVRSDFNLTVGFSAKIDAKLTIGAVTQSVEVTGENPVIDTVNTLGNNDTEARDPGYPEGRADTGNDADGGGNQFGWQTGCWRQQSRSPGPDHHLRDPHAADALRRRA